MQFKSHITFRYRENTANAKSVLSVLGACIKSGDEIELVCEGKTNRKRLRRLCMPLRTDLENRRVREENRMKKILVTGCNGQLGAQSAQSMQRKT